MADQEGFESGYMQNEAGITVAIQNPLGVETRLGLDAGNRVQQLYRRQALLAGMSYDGEGRFIPELLVVRCRLLTDNLEL